MNYVKNFYSGFKNIFEPNEPIKATCIPKNNLLVKDAILRPLFKYEPYMFNPKKYDKLCKTHPTIFSSINYSPLEKDDIDNLSDTNTDIYKEVSNNVNLDEDIENNNDSNIKNILNSKLLIAVLFVNVIILYKAYKK